MTATVQCLPCFSGLHKLFATEELPREVETSVGKLLKEALDNGTLEKALSTPTRIKPFPLPSCPYLSGKSLQRQVKTVLEDGLANGILSLQQAEELRDLIATYNLLQSQQQAEKNPAEILRSVLEESLENGSLSKALVEDMCSRASGNTLQLFPIVAEIFSGEQEEVKANVGRLLEDSLNNGTLEKVLTIPATINIPLPSCPNMSGKCLKEKVKMLLEDGLASGTLRLDQAQELCDVVASYNHLQSQLQAQKDALVIIDYSKIHRYTPPERQLDISANQPNLTEGMSHAVAKSSKLDPKDVIGADVEKEQQIQERKSDKVC